MDVLGGGGQVGGEGEGGSVDYSNAPHLRDIFFSPLRDQKVLWLQ